MSKIPKEASEKTVVSDDDVICISDDDEPEQAKKPEQNKKKKKNKKKATTAAIEDDDIQSSFEKLQFMPEDQVQPEPPKTDVNKEIVAPKKNTAIPPNVKMSTPLPLENRIFGNLLTPRLKNGVTNVSVLVDSAISKGFDRKQIELVLKENKKAWPEKEFFDCLNKVCANKSIESDSDAEKIAANRKKNATKPVFSPSVQEPVNKKFNRAHESPKVLLTTSKSVSPNGQKVQQRQNDSECIIIDDLLPPPTTVASSFKPRNLANATGTDNSPIIVLGEYASRLINDDFNDKNKEKDNKTDRISILLSGMTDTKRADAIDHLNKRLAKPVAGTNSAASAETKSKKDSSSKSASSSKENEEDKMSITSVESMDDGASSKLPLPMKKIPKKKDKEKKAENEKAPEFAIPETTSSFIPSSMRKNKKKSPEKTSAAKSSNINDLVKLPDKNLALAVEVLSKPENIEKLAKLAPHSANTHKNMGTNNNPYHSDNNDRPNRRLNNFHNAYAGGHVHRGELKAKNFKNERSKSSNPRHSIYEKHLNNRNNANNNRGNNNFNNNADNNAKGSAGPIVPLPRGLSNPPKPIPSSELRFIVIDASNVARE
jgi:hypothetical protein